MKKRLFKKALTSTAAILTIAALAVPGISVFAVDTPTAYTQAPNKLSNAAANADVTVNKDIVLFNVDGSKILSPNVTYSYEITPATITNATITTKDSDNNIITVKVRSGVLAAVSTTGDDNTTNNKVEGSITFGTDNTTKYTTNQNSATDIDLTNKVRSSMTISVNANKIFNPNYDAQAQTNAQVNGPGVYRYKITDVTDAATLNASGITDGGAADTIYLDVYTKYADDNKNSLVIYGYVLLKNTNDHDDVEITYDTTATETLKITGFDTDSENTVTTGTSVAAANLKSDSYKTYNVEVKKETAGDLADAQHNFPFKVELTNTNTVTSLDDFYYVITKDGTQTEVITHLSDAGAWTLDGTEATNNLQLQNGDSILITGLPVNTQIKVTETNDTADTYTVSAKGNNNDLTLKRNDNTTGTSLSVATNGTAELSALANVNKTAGKDEIVFTNTLKDISVTGLMFSIAPFVFITIAGVALLVLVMKNRKNSDNKSKI